MTSWRMFPPPSGAAQSLVVKGRTYAATPGASLDVPDFDGTVLRANGWLFIGIVGTTAQRPTDKLQRHETYIDTTLNAAIFFDGVTWRDYAGVAA